MNEFEMKELKYGEHPSTVTGRFKDSLDVIKQKVFWEANSAVKRNTNIDPKQIISKRATHDFPEGITVRTHRMKDGHTSAYFHADVKQKYYGSGNNKTYFNTVGHKLIVTFPATYGSTEYGYSFNGILNKEIAFNEMGRILDYIKSELDTMYDNGN